MKKTCINHHNGVLPQHCKAGLAGLMNPCKKIKALFLELFLICGMLNVAQAADVAEQTGQASGIPADLQTEMRKIFSQEDAVVRNGKCSFECRKVNDGYGTQIIGYDFKNGMTYCSVFELSNQELPLRFNADKQNEQCVDDSLAIYANTNFAKRDRTANIKSSITQTLSDSEITLSRFLTSMATLDPNIIDREMTYASGQLTLVNGITTRGSVGGLYDYSPGDTAYMYITKLPLISTAMRFFYKPDKKPQPIGNGEKISMADSFNKSNMAYFSNLYQNMSSIYTHLQNLLFIVVGGFFLAAMGFNKLQTYLEHKGQFSGRNEPYLHKFLIPLIAVAAFYMPIPESTNTSATIVQKVIRYFTAQANNIADLASAEGAKTYMNKIYSSVGGIDQSMEVQTYIDFSIASFTRQKAEEEYKNRCIKRYTKPVGVPYAQMTEKQIKELMEKYDIKQVAGTENDISFQACIYLENQIWQANAEKSKTERMLKSIDKYYKNNYLQDNLNAIDKYTAGREKEFGWINSILLPGTALMAEIQDYISDNTIQDKDELETSSKKSQVANQDAATQGVLGNLDGDEDLTEKMIGWLMGRLVYMTIPGASGMNQAISSLFEHIGDAFNGIPVAGPSISSVIKILGDAGSFVATTYIVEAMIEYVPILVATVSASLAFIGYLVSLIKYFYISPFVVAFALTTKRVDKIVAFLVSGISIFFKPVLIVLFIYLALFLHTLVKELFITFSVEQFGAIKLSDYDFMASFAIYGIQAMLGVFGVLASSYVMWKTIIGGPDWTFKFLGLDKDTDNIISQGLSQRLEQRSFMA